MQAGCVGRSGCGYLDIRITKIKGGEPPPALKLSEQPVQFSNIKDNQIRLVCRNRDILT